MSGKRDHFEIKFDRDPRRTATHASYNSTSAVATRLKGSLHADKKLSYCAGPRDALCQLKFSHAIAAQLHEKSQI